MKCINHPKKEAAGGCINCGNLLCADCLIKVGNKNYCKNCVKEILGDKTRETEKKPIMQQQQQQAVELGDSFAKLMDDKKPVAYAAPIKWIVAIFTLLVAIGFFGNGKYYSGTLLFLLGLYWVPPIMDKTQSFLTEKYGFKIPRWLRILASIILFFISYIMHY